jgi:oligoendopeptidase F
VTHLLGALYFIPYGCMVDEFQHIVYDNPDLTPAQRHEVWADLEKQYRPWIDFEGATFFAEGRTWQRKHHIYNFPFYYIDYCLAQTVALEVLSIMLEKGWDAAWEVYVNFTKQFGDDTFVNMLANAGLHNPFQPGTMRNTLTAIEKFVDENLHHLN